MRHLALTFVFAAIAASIGAVACESTEVAEPRDDDDGGSTVPGADAGGLDDAGEETDADAASAEVCTEDDFCHTILPPDQTLRGVWADGDGIAWAVSEQGNILRWDGAAWSVSHANAGALHAIWGSSATDIWVGGARGLLHGAGPTSKDLTWTAVDVPGLDGVPIQAIAGRSASDVWAVAGRVDLDTFPPPIEGRILHFAGKGGWTIAAPAPENVMLTNVWTAAGGQLWIGGTNFENYPVQHSRGVLLRGDAATGGGLTTIVLPAIAHSGGDEAVEMITGGTSVGGEVIALVVSVGFGVFLRGHEETDGGDTFAWTQEMFAVHPSHRHRTVWAASPDDVWVAGDYGRLRHWNGTTWSLPRISAGQIPEIATFHAMWARSPDELWFVGDRIALHKRPSKK